jgi:hypothetical protein
VATASRKPTDAELAAAAARHKLVAKAAHNRAQKKSANDKLQPGELLAIQKYLEAPVGSGFWRLTAKRRFDGAYLRYLADKNGIALDEFELKEAEQPPVGTDEEKKRKELEKLSTFFSAITVGMLAKQKVPDLEIAAMEHGVRASDWAPEDILQQFSDLVSLLEQRIYHANFLPMLSVASPFRLASGYAVLLDGWLVPEVVFASTTREPLNDLSAILDAAELVADSRVERIFSPEEELFQPYFQFLQISYDEIIKDPRIKAGLETASDHFTKGEFTHCISSLGLVAEDYLTQVYEFYLRQSCAKGSTLGQIYDQLHSGIRDVVAPPPAELADLDPIFKLIKTLSATKSESADTYSKKIESTLREILTAMKQDRQFYLGKINAATKPNRRVSVFPHSVHESLMELIRNRNAASHKTRIPLGSFEALRTLHCLVAFVQWWHSARSTTDWAQTREQLLRDAVTQASS